VSLTSKISTKRSQIEHIGSVLKLSEPAISKTDPGFENCPRFVEVSDHIKRTFLHDYISEMKEIRRKAF